MLGNKPSVFISQISLEPLTVCRIKCIFRSFIPSLSCSKYPPKQENLSFFVFFHLYVYFSCLCSCLMSEAAEKHPLHVWHVGCSFTSSEETWNNGSLSSFVRDACAALFIRAGVWRWAAVSCETCGSLSSLRLLKQSHKIGRKCLFDANPNKSAAVRGRSLRCLRVLAQTCLMSRSADIYSAAASFIYIKREREGDNRRAAAAETRSAQAGRDLQ